MTFKKTKSEKGAGHKFHLWIDQIVSPLGKQWFIELTIGNRDYVIKSKMRSL